MKKTLLIAAIFGSFAVVSCKKQSQDTPAATTAATINDIKVPAGFSWENSRNVSISVSTTDTRFGAAAVQNIAVYDGDPYTTGKLLTQGGATSTGAFTANIYLSNLITQIYVVKTSPDKSTIVQKVAVGTAPVTLTIGAIDPDFAIRSTPGTKQVAGASPASPDCSGGTQITTSTNNLNVNSGDTYSITGSNITINFSNVNGGTIKVCGSNVTLQNLSFNGGATLQITSGGSVTIPSINFNSSAAIIQNWGTVNYQSAFPDNGVVSNYGTFNVSSDFNLNAQAGIFTNNGTMNISGTFNDGTTAVATNNGVMNVSGSFQPNSSSNFVNNCALYVTANYNQSSGVKNYSYISVGGTTTINASSELGMYNGAMVKTKDFIVDGTVAGYGSTSLVKITGTTTIRNSGSVVTNVEVWQVNGTIDATSASKVNSPATTTDHSVYIATSGCNSEGNGTATAKDTDGDGVADNLDAYPNDPKRAYNVSGATGTLAYEDTWPTKGDYDMNDVVMGYNYTLVTSASNIVVDVAGTYTLYATGGGYTNAFGVEFPVSKSLVSGLSISKAGVAVSNPTFEPGQTKAVVIIFTNMRDEMATWNTRSASIEGFTAYKNYAMSYTITGGPSLSSFGQDAYNPFIFNGGRGREIHLMGKTPTSLYDSTLYGTADDNSNVAAGRYYVTKTGLPWAINLPVAFTSYPTERTDITATYLHFAEWATSGGSSYADWYSSTATGYRLVANIFTH